MASKHWRYLVATALLSASVPFAAATSVGATVPAFETGYAPLVEAAGTQDSPDVSGSHVVWADWRHDEGSWTNAEIYAYDLESEEETRLTETVGEESEPHVSGNWVVFSYWGDDPGNGDICAIDLTTGERKTLTPWGSRQEWPDVAGDYAFYEDDRGGQYDIYAYDLVNDIESQVTSNGADQRFVSADGSRIAYYDPSKDSRLAMFDLSTMTESEIATATTYNWDRAFVSGDEVLYFGSDTGVTYFPYVYNAITHSTEQIVTDLPVYLSEGSFAFNSDYFVYLASGGDSNMVPQGGGNLMRVVDRSSGQEFAIGEGVIAPFNPALAGATLVWREGAFDMYGDIYVNATPDPDAPVTEIAGVPASWVNRDVEFSLSATDTGSGVKETWYALGGEESLYEPDTTVTVSAEGATPITYWSIDVAGNIESSREATAYVDKSYPFTDRDDVAAEYLDSATVELHPQDAVSGVHATYYRIDGGRVRSGTTVDISVAGTRTVEYWSVDNAGNIEQPSSFDVHVRSTKTAYVSVAGADRIKTALESAQTAFPDGIEGTDYEGFRTAILATARNWPDALGAASLGGALGGPILLTEPGALSSDIAAEIERLGADRVIIVGGTSAVSGAVENAVAVIPGIVEVERIAGADRYRTADSVATRAVEALGGDYDGTAFVTTGLNFADALSASPLAAAKGWPIFLVRSAGPDSQTAACMEALGVTDVLILGGPSALSAEVAQGLSADYSVERLAGPDRYATSVAIANYAVTSAGMHWDPLAIATGEEFPDGIACGVMQGRAGAVVLLTYKQSLPAIVGETLDANKDLIGTVRYLGGSAAVATTVREQVASILHADN